MRCNAGGLVNVAFTPIPKRNNSLAVQKLQTDLEFVDARVTDSQNMD